MERILYESAPFNFLPSLACISDRNALFAGVDAVIIEGCSTSLNGYDKGGQGSMSNTSNKKARLSTGP